MLVFAPVVGAALVQRCHCAVIFKVGFLHFFLGFLSRICIGYYLFFSRYAIVFVDFYIAFLADFRRREKG